MRFRTADAIAAVYLRHQRLPTGSVLLVLNCRGPLAAFIGSASRNRPVPVNPKHVDAISSDYVPCRQNPASIAEVHKAGQSVYPNSAGLSPHSVEHDIRCVSSPVFISCIDQVDIEPSGSSGRHKCRLRNLVQCRSAGLGMTSPPAPFRKPASGPSPTAARDIADWQALVESSVERVTAAAEK